MTRADAVAEICSRTKLTNADLEGFLACSPAEQAELVEAYRIAGVMPSASAWDVVLEVLGKCAELASLVAPIVGVVQGVFSIVATAKGTPP